MKESLEIIYQHPVATVFFILAIAWSIISIIEMSKS